MKTSIVVLLGLVASFTFFTGCKKESPVSPDDFELQEINCEASALLCDLTNANLSFGFDLLRSLQQLHADDNIFVSPLSLSTALSMALIGAEGQTDYELRAALHLEMFDEAELLSANKLLLEKLPFLDKNTKLGLSNAIFYRKEYPILPSFLDANREYFQSEIEALDLSGPESAKQQINDWVSESTQGTINDLVDRVPANLVMYLINTLYFKSGWSQPFDEELSYTGTFTRQGKQAVEVDYMQKQEVAYPYFRGNGFQMVDLAYGDSVYSMTLMLPDEGILVNELLNSLQADTWHDWIGQLEDTELMISMPKFKLSWESAMNETLQELGVSDAFDAERADFSGISDQGGLFISEVKHKTFIEVNEKGTEASAASSVGVSRTSIPDIPILQFNRPYLFMIRENQSNSILFIGKMMDPSLAD